MNTALLSLDRPTQTAPSPRPDWQGTAVCPRTAADRFPTSVRVPVLKANREYLRALRAAEMAAWGKAKPRPVTAQTNRETARRLGPAEDRGSRLETATFAVLGLCVAFVIGHSLWVGAMFVAAW